MALPFFYNSQLTVEAGELSLDEETSRHIVQVLRMQPREELHLTDGKGNIFTASILDAQKKHCRVAIRDRQHTDTPAKKAAIAISLLKNNTRFEWFLEKATELGVSEIIPLLCERTEREKFRYERMQQIVISAMLQSQQCWLPVLHQPIGFELLLRQEDIIGMPVKYIAHCMESEKAPLSVSAGFDSTIILIGPEGDFTASEVGFALQNDFHPVSLGPTRLRTETAGVVAATFLCIQSD